MPTFHYKALDLDGRQIQGTLDAPDRRTALRKLRAADCRPITLAATSEKKTEALSFESGPSAPAPARKFSFLPHARGEVLALGLLSKLHQLTQGGMPVGDAVKSLAQRLSEPAQRELATRLWHEISEGRTLAAAMRQYPETFTPATTHLIEAGEATGHLHSVLERLIEHLEQQRTLKKRILAGLAYPTALTVMAAGVVLFIVFWFLPIIRKMITSMGGELTLPARILITFSELFVFAGPVVLLGLACACLYLWKWRQTEAGREQTDLWLVRLPIVRTLVHHAETARFTNLLATLLANGVNTTESLRLTARAIHNTTIQTRFQSARTLINDGAAFSTAFRKHRLLRDEDLDILGVGENTGAPIRAFERIHRIHAEILKARIQTLSTLLVSAALGAAFTLVTLIVLSIVLTILNLTSTLGKV